jgi:uncharacterized membrane protein YfcA
MIEILLQFKWIFLIIAEIFAWTTTVTMFLGRYWWESKTVFWISLILSFITGIGIQLGIAALNLIKGNKAGIFEICVILLALYSFTYGKKHIKALDQKIMNWSRRKRQRKVKGISG